jgi:hypothetical protein
MIEPVSSTRESGSAGHQPRTGTAPRAPRATGLSVSLWLLAALLAEAELLLWLLERAYSV